MEIPCNALKGLDFCGGYGSFNILGFMEQKHASPHRQFETPLGPVLPYWTLKSRGWSTSPIANLPLSPPQNLQSSHWKGTTISNILCSQSIDLWKSPFYLRGGLSMANYNNQLINKVPTIQCFSTALHLTDYLTELGIYDALICSNNFFSNFKWDCFCLGLMA